MHIGFNLPSCNFFLSQIKNTSIGRFHVNGPRKKGQSQKVDFFDEMGKIIRQIDDFGRFLNNVCNFGVLLAKNQKFPKSDCFVR